MDIKNAPHLRRVIKRNKLQTTVEELSKLLTPHYDKFDSIIVSGLSGTLVGPALALAMGKEISVARKDRSGDCHSDRSIEGAVECRAVWVDDFICTGVTADRVAKQAAANDITIVGAAMFMQGSDSLEYCLKHKEYVKAVPDYFCVGVPPGDD